METLYRRHADPLYAYALRSTGRADQAEEIVQETFIRAFKGLARFSGRSSFKTWLYAIAINRARTQLKKRPRAEVELSSVPLTTREHEPVGWTQARLQKALDALPQGYREVVVMHDVLEMEHQEIAAYRGCSVGTSKSQLHKARAKLRALLGAMGDGDV